MTKYKCVIIGYGYMGKIRQAVIERNPRLELTGIYETDPEVQKEIQNCYCFQSFEEIFDKNVDIMFVCTPNIYSPDLCIQSMKRAKQVFCEKPPGRYIDDIKQIQKAETNGVKLMFGFNHRFHPAIMKAKEFVESGQFGDVVFIEGVYGKTSQGDLRKDWRGDKKMSGGGVLLDQGIHMLDLFRYFCGDFEQVKCFTGHRRWNLEVEDDAFVILQNSQGLNGFLHTSMNLRRCSFDLNIVFKKGTIRMNGLLSKSGRYGPEKLFVRRKSNGKKTEPQAAEEEFCFEKDLSWDLEVEIFLDCILNDTPVWTGSSHDAYKVMELIDKAYKDAGEHS